MIRSMRPQTNGDFGITERFILLKRGNVWQKKQL
jgi:hypothetical protein